MNLKQIIMAPVLLTSLLLTGCGSGSSSDPENFGGPTLSSTRQGAAPFIQLDTLQAGNPAVGVYKYSGTDGQKLVGTLVVPDDKDYDLYFYDANGDRVAMVETSGNGVDETLEYTIDGFTTLYIVIYDGEGDVGDNEGENYGFTLSEQIVEEEVVVELTEVDEAAGDNGTFANAEVASVNTVISGSLNRPSLTLCENVDCDDYYILDVEEGDTLTISLTGDAGTNFDLYLYQANEAYITHSENSDSTETLDYTVPNGTSQLYIHVLAYDGTGSYELTIESSMITPNTCETEVGTDHSSLAGAQVITGDSVCGELTISLIDMGSVFVHESETDNYTFDVTEGMVITAELEGLPAQYLQYHMFNGVTGSSFGFDDDFDGIITYTVASGVTKILLQVLYTELRDSNTEPAVTSMSYELTVTSNDPS